jgi:hypothetical protein
VSTSPRRALAAAVAAALLATSVPGTPPRAATTLEGSYNLMLDIRKQDRNYPWDFDSNNPDTYSNAEFRLFSAPRPGVEAFLKIGAQWNRDNNNGARPVFQYREAHARYRWDLNNKGFDTYLFSRQNRFWVENHLIQVVQSDPPNNGGNAQGFRVDSWGFLGGLNATLIASDFSGEFDPSNSSRTDPSKTGDAYILRLRREALNRKLRMGFTYNRKVENQAGSAKNSYYDVIAGDLRYTVKNTDVSLEYAVSDAQGPTVTAANYLYDYTVDAGGKHIPDSVQVLGRKFLGLPLNDRGVWVGEIRSIKMGSPTLGYLNVAPTGWIRGPLYDNKLGDSNRDERGYLISTWYLVPQRAITLTNNFLGYSKGMSRQTVRELYSEAYVEFVHGFTGKAFYRRHRTTTEKGGGLQQYEKQDDVFLELQVESRLAWLRIEGKLQNIGTQNEKQIAAIETSVNVGAKTKIYNRLMFGNDPTSLRRILFTQLQYRPSGNMDLFVQYGPEWIGSGSRPVDNGDLAGSATQRDIVKVYFQGNF